MTPLTAGNARVKDARKLSRRSVRSERRLFLADGPKAVEGALGVPGCVVEVFATADAAERYAGLLSDADVTLVDDRALASLSDAVSPAGVVAVCNVLDVPLPRLLGLAADRAGRAAAGLAGRAGADLAGRAAARDERRVETRSDVAGLDTPSPGGSGYSTSDSGRVETSGADLAGRAAARDERRVETLIVICADVRDPGNAGTIIRTADAAGADGVVLAGDAVDAYNPKTVRASVGSLFHVPVAVERDAAVAVRTAQQAGLTVLAADGGGEVDLFEADDLLRPPTAWLFGNEAWGLPEELAALADHRVRIPILGRAESLNLATAAALCLYASARVRRG